MTCDRCGNRQAEVHLTTIKGNETAIRHFCTVCSHAVLDAETPPELLNVLRKSPRARPTKVLGPVARFARFLGDLVLGRRQDSS
jgi:hypothetical protein